MSLPTVTQTWTYSFNNRYVFPSGGTLTTTMGALMFSLVGVGGFLPSTMGYTVKGSSNGTTAGMDNTNRITSASAWGTNANSSSSPISWIVLTDGAGVDWLFAYDSASADIVRLSHSQGGNYVAASTPTNLPTATDECFDAASGTWIGATASADRVWHMWGSSDKKMFRFATCRQGVMTSLIVGEKFTSAIVAPATFSLAIGSGTVAAIKGYMDPSTINTWMGAYSATADGALCRVHAGGLDSNCKTIYGGESFNGWATYFNAERPALQGGLGDLIFPVQYYSSVANTDGKLGSAVDLWYVLTNLGSVPALTDVFGSLQFVSLAGGGPLLPIDGSTILVAA